MKDHIKEYKKNLEKSIGEYMAQPATERSAEAVSGMLDCWMCLNKAEGKMSYTGAFTHEDAKKWADKLVNDDGTMGAHWTLDETTGVAKTAGVMFEHITDWCWWITMNMMFSDYCKVAMNYGVNSPQFYADMSKAFLFDKDAPTPEEKLGAYYHGIVCRSGEEY